MMLRLPSVLDPNQLDTVCKLLADAKFVDGKLSAGTAASRVKHNQELDKNARQMDMLNNIVMNSLVQHPVYRAGALPLRVAAPYYARYTPGMAYGDHLDDPVMGADCSVLLQIELSSPRARVSWRFGAHDDGRDLSCSAGRCAQPDPVLHLHRGCRKRARQQARAGGDRPAHCGGT